MIASMWTRVGIPLGTSTRLCVPIIQGINIQAMNLRTVRNQEQAASAIKTQIITDEPCEEERKNLDNFWSKINQEIVEKLLKKRLFAVAHIYGKMHLFTVGDYIMFQKYFPAEIGTKIKIEKVCLVGSDNLTLVGRPVLDRDLVHIEATLVEKTMTHTINNIIIVPRKCNYRRWNFNRKALSVVRINEIKVCHKLNESQDEVQ